MPQSRKMSDKMNSQPKGTGNLQNTKRNEEQVAATLTGDRDASNLQPSEEKDPLQPPSKKTYSSTTSTELLSSESIATLAQSILDEMEEKRKNDQSLLADFRKDFDQHVETSSDMLAQTLERIYTKNNNSCQEKLQELNTMLEHISQLEHEMLTFKHSLNMLFTEVNPGQ